MYSVENRLGRLVEVRLAVPLTLDEIRTVGTVCRHEMGKALRRQPQKLAVVVSDLRGLRLLSPELFEGLTEVLRSNNALCERTGQVTQKSAVLAMQADRAVREAGHTERRNFNQPEQLIAYLKEVLTEKETERVRAFLSEYEELDSPP